MRKIFYVVGFAVVFAVCLLVRQAFAVDAPSDYGFVITQYDEQPDISGHVEYFTPVGSENGFLGFSGAAGHDAQTYYMDVDDFDYNGNVIELASGLIDDMMPSQAGNSGKFLTTNGTAMSWTNAASAAWGSITGTLSSQSDIVTALAGKEPTVTIGSTSQYYRGDKTFQTLNSASIGDSTSVGRSVLTAATAADARTAIGAGTGSGTVTSVTAGTGLSGGTITATGTISMPNIGTASTYSGVTTDAQGRVTAGTTRSFAYPTRSLNSCFQPSSTRDSQVSYSVDVSTVSTLLSGQQGTIYLRIYTNSGCTTGTQEVARFVNGNTQALGLSVTMTQNVTGTLTGMIPAGSYVQLVTENNTGTPTFTYRSAQEVQL